MRGRVHVYGDHVDTDLILPGRYLTLRRPEELAKHCLEGLDPNFSQTVRRGDILVAGRNFGSGSSREHAPIAIKAAGVACVIAKSFARIFYRNAINIGLPVVVCPPFVDAARSGDMAEVELETGVLRLGTACFTAEPVAPYIASITSAGGLVAFVRDELDRRANTRGSPARGRPLEQTHRQRR
jgi:3-isopropylmalate/(R)-2-methylmalate dehydratase small subunit